MRFVILTCLLALALAPAASAQLPGCDATVAYEWTAPTTGAPVVEYVVQRSENGGAWAEVGRTPGDRLEWLLCATNGVEYQLRVAGVDSLGRQGPWSEPSDPYTVPVAPGPPGKPTIAYVTAAVVLLLGLLGLLHWRQQRAT